MCCINLVIWWLRAIKTYWFWSQLWPQFDHCSVLSWISLETCLLSACFLAHPFWNKIYWKEMEQDFLSNCGLGCNLKGTGDLGWWTRKKFSSVSQLMPVGLCLLSFFFFFLMTPDSFLLKKARWEPGNLMMGVGEWWWEYRFLLKRCQLCLWDPQLVGLSGVPGVLHRIPLEIPSPGVLKYLALGDDQKI